MRQEWPVRLELSLGETIHGYAWAPRYNHQPQTVDATGLRLTGDRLHGEVTVTVVPDCYHDHEVSFDLGYRIDARVAGHTLVGTFTGRDGDLATAGPITGELTAKRSGVATGLADYRAAELDLGLAQPSGKPAGVIDRRLQVRLRLVAGGIVEAMAVDPQDGASIKTVVDPRLALVGDRLTGSLVITSDVGRSTYDLVAIVDGDRLDGYWRGTHAGRPILTKSSKLGGRLLRTDD
jgi:hypothetical protein